MRKARRTRSISLMPANGATDAAHAVDQQRAAQDHRRAQRPVLHAAQRERDQQTMMIALKITADRIADSGEARPMMLSGAIWG
jgi:hypothetical protein